VRSSFPVAKGCRRGDPGVMLYGRASTKTPVAQVSVSGDGLAQMAELLGHRRMQ